MNLVKGKYSPLFLIQNKMPDREAFRNSSRKTFPDIAQAQQDWEAYRKTTGTINFIAPLSKWETEKPFNLALPLPRNQPKSNSVYEAQEIQISDGRGKEGDFSLDVHGFEFLEMPPGDTLRDGDAIENEYLSLMESFLKEHLGAERVVCFDYALREVRRDLTEGEFVEWRDKRPAARNAHTDQTPEAAMSRLRLYFDEDAEVLIKSRVRFINIWRPLIQPLEDTPLAVLDARTLTDEDLLAHDIIYAHYQGENYLVRFNSNQRWYYLNRMATKECILIKNFDSNLSSCARMCPHAAFNDANSPPNAPWRKSIETRFMVFN
ncbi:hypothetical protein F4802DRAFT_609813 [Xylaria palmicola]|nr:hypothetical protein F4802DRAFT_609813 [Xylaria palmicola]